MLLRILGRNAAIALVLCAFGLGALRTQCAFTVSQPSPGQYEITACVSGGTRLRSDNRISFTLTDIYLDGQPADGKAYCSLHYDETPPALFDGARVRFSGRVYLPDGKSGEPHPDFRMWMRQQNLSFGIAAYQGIIVENTPETAPVVSLSHRILTWCGSAYERIMGENGRIAMALMFGDRSGLTEDESNSFETLGIAHVMSVSGLHVGILGTLVARLLRKWKKSEHVQLLLLAVFLAGYCGLTGFSAAANRSAIMLLAYKTARLVPRRADRLTLLSGALIAVLLAQPLQVFSAGFVLSFSAMLGITLYASHVRNLLDQLWPEIEPVDRLHWKLFVLQDDLKSLLVISITAQLGVLLPTAVYFHQLPLYGILINLLIVPFVSSVLVPLYALALCISLLPAAGPIVGWAASLLTECLLWLVRLLSALPHASLRVGAPSGGMCLWLALMAALPSARLPLKRAVRWKAFALAVLAAAGTAWIQRPADVRYIQLAVGQADCALLLDGGTTVMIDAGTDGQAALDYLMDENRNVDALVITHLHMDHIGGVQQLLDSSVSISHVYLPFNAERQRIDPDALLLLERIRHAGIPITELASGDELRYNKTSLKVLWPVRENVRSGHDANDMPLVMSIDLDGYTLLSASDLTGAYEAYAAVPADVLKVAHHGSADSSGSDFLQFVSPQIALLSVSSGSSWLPGRATLERLEAVGAQTLRTDTCGDITLSLTDGVLRATPYKAR